MTDIAVPFTATRPNELRNTAALYARYSCENQRETSIEDQLRRCRELAAKHGLVINEQHIYADSAMSGTATAIDRREGYKALLAAWGQNQFDFILADDVDRITRDGVEQALLVRRLESNLRVHLVTNDGIDSRTQNWQLMMSVRGIVGQQQVRTTKSLVVRGMVGQLERGFMIATPAFGYVLDRQFDGQGNRIGTHWKIEESSASLVRLIFEKRGAGQSMHQIARWLNEQGVALQRKAQKSTGGFWRASRIKDLLKNPTYRGEFIWNASTTLKAKAKKSGAVLAEQAFARPELRLVSDELWYRCNSKTISRSGYGGGSHPFTGLLSCGLCDSVLVLTSKSRCRSLYCASCTTAQGMNVKGAHMTSTIATQGVQILLSHALGDFLTPAFVETFRTRLKLRLSGDNSAAIEALQRELGGLKNAQERLSRMLANAVEDDPVLMQRYEELREQVKQLNSQLVRLNGEAGRVDQSAIGKQMTIDPGKLVERVFTFEQPPEALRALLARLFPRIVFEGKPGGRYTSIFGLEFAMGDALALASGTAIQMTAGSTKRYQLTYHPAGRVRLGQPWTVLELSDVDTVPLHPGGDQELRDHAVHPGVMSSK